MTQEQYSSLTYKEKIFADLLLRIAVATEKLGKDISADLERTLP